MHEYTLKDLLEMTRGRPHGTMDGPVKRLLTDSRQVISPSDTVFFAIRGKQRDGHEFIDDAYGKGIRQFVLTHPGTIRDKPDASYIAVDDPLNALQVICARHRKSFTGDIIGITGSNGKTIVKEWLYQLLVPEKVVIRSPRSYNSQIGVPLSVWLLEEGADLAIVEAGISEPGEMDRLEKIIQPTIGVFTNIGEAHQQHFRSLEEKINEKLLLFTNARTLVYCKDHTSVHETIRKNRSLKKKPLFTWSFSREADLRIISLDSVNGWTKLSALYRGETVKIQIPFSDSASIENAVHAWSTVLLLGYDPSMIAPRFKQLEPVAMRLEMKKGINQCTIINDSYNSDLVALRVALDRLNQQKQHSKKTVILSDIFQSGKPDASLYREVNLMLEKSKVGRFIGVGRSLENNRNAFTVPSAFYRSTDDFISAFNHSWFSNEAILLKGSRDFAFERISSLLEEKAHQTVLEVDLQALVNNLKYFREKLNPGTKIMVMVKALSYGSGTYEIANVLQYNKVDYLTVAFADEAVTLREAGITLPVMVMNPDARSIDTMIRYNLEPEIYSFGVLQTVLERIKRYGLDTLPVHIKIDTGMHRLGFMTEEIDRLLDVLTHNRQLLVRSVFSHLAASENPSHDSFTQQQIALFTVLSEKLALGLPYRFLRHILNSSGIERFPSCQFDMVRLGIGLYGISSVADPNLMNVATLRSVILQLKKVSNNQSIGYGRAGRSGDGKTIAIVPVGYADGLDRRLGNGVGWFLIKGRRAPLIGNLCMDMCMVDVTGMDVQEGDEVIIFGEGHTIGDMARELNTIPYEVMTGISQRVKRIYFQE